MSVETLGVVGSGTMGNGIAHAAAASGRRVVMVDVARTLLDRALATIDKNLQRGVDKGKMNVAEKSAVLARIEATTELGRLSQADFVVEAVFEDEAVKKDLFGKLDGIARPGVILASNTSSISITRIATATRRPERIIGMHFMNPVPVMKLVEVIRGLATSDATFAETKALAESMEKVPVEVNDY